MFSGQGLGVIVFLTSCWDSLGGRPQGFRKFWPSFKKARKFSVKISDRFHTVSEGSQKGSEQFPKVSETFPHVSEQVHRFHNVRKRGAVSEISGQVSESFKRV